MGPSLSSKMKSNILYIDDCPPGREPAQKYCLELFYQENLIGDDCEKFQIFKEFICNSEEFQILMDEEGIDLPNDAYEILSKDGFLDTMTE